MKIEKLTENKIRVIIDSSELGLNNANLHNVMTKSIETQEIFLTILKKAEKELNFNTDGCKLLIEAFSSFDDILVFTITKFLPDTETQKKKLIVKRKSFKPVNKHITCHFINFDTFCSFCYNLKALHNFVSKDLAKNTILYFWKNSYYLVLKNISNSSKEKNIFFSTLSEFGKLLPYSNIFEYKLLEHGKVIIKKNALDVGMKFLAS